jgi:hypothetical protein
MVGVACIQYHDLRHVHPSVSSSGSGRIVVADETPVRLRVRTFSLERGSTRKW